MKYIVALIKIGVGVAIIAILLYIAAIFFVAGVAWVTGEAPAHYIWGMLPYSDWKIK